MMLFPDEQFPFAGHTVWIKNNVKTTLMWEFYNSLMFYAPEKCKLKLNNLILNMTIEIGKYCRIFKAQSRGNPHQPTNLWGDSVIQSFELVGPFEALGSLELIGSFELVGPYEAIGSPELISSFEAIHSLELVESFKELGHRNRLGHLKQFSHLSWLGHL